MKSSSVNFEKIKKLAKIRNLSLVELNDMAGLGTRSIYHWKKNRPSDEAIKAVAQVLNVLPEELLVTEDKEATKKDHNIAWSDLGMAFGGYIPDDLKSYYKAIAEAYVMEHPEIAKKIKKKGSM